MTLLGEKMDELHNPFRVRVRARARARKFFSSIQTLLVSMLIKMAKKSR